MEGKGGTTWKRKTSSPKETSVRYRKALMATMKEMTSDERCNYEPDEALEKVCEDKGRLGRE